MVVRGRKDAARHRQQEQEQDQEQQRQLYLEEEQRVYLVTEGLRSKYTKASYESAFRQFKKFMEFQDERVLANYKPSIIEQRVIRYIEIIKNRLHSTLLPVTENIIKRFMVECNNQR